MRCVGLKALWLTDTGLLDTMAPLQPGKDIMWRPAGIYARPSYHSSLLQLPSFSIATTFSNNIC